MHKIKKFAIDDFPHTLLPCEAFDYSSKLMVSLLFEPIFYCENEIYKSNIIKDTVETKEKIDFYFKKVYWSNGEKIRPRDFYTTLVYIIKNVPVLSIYLTFIEGIDEDQSNIDLNEIKVQYDDEKISLKKKYQCNFKKVFSIIQFSLMYFGKDDLPSTEIYSGKFQLEEYCVEKNFLRVKKNRWYSPQEIEFDKIDFIYVDNEEENIELFEKGITDFTCSTLFPFHYLEKYKGNAVFFKQESNIEIAIEINTKKFEKYKTSLKQFMLQKLSDDVLFSEGLNLVKYKEGDFIFEKEHYAQPHERILIIAPDYYPNKEVISFVKSYFEEQKFLVEMNFMPLKKYLKYKNTNKYDIALTLSSLILNNQLEHFLTEMKFIKEEKLDDYIDLLNQYLSNSSRDLSVKINQYITQNSKRFILGKINHIYLRSENLKQISFNENDIYSFK